VGVLLDQTRLAQQQTQDNQPTSNRKEDFEFAFLEPQEKDNTELCPIYTFGPFGGKHEHRVFVPIP
jgi:hypothetical protein